MSFWAGFEKRANVEDMLEFGLHGLGYGAMGGAALGVMLANLKANAVLSKWKKDPRNMPAADVFKKYKSFAPGVKFYSASDLKKMEESGHPEDRDLAEQLRSGAEEGNAAYLRLPGLGAASAHYIVTDDKIMPSVVAHEIGHFLSQKELAKVKDRAEQDKKVSDEIGEEESAWKLAPGEIDEEIKKDALNTYRRGRRWPLIGLAGGALVGGAGGAYLGKMISGVGQQLKTQRGFR